MTTNLQARSLEKNIIQFINITRLPVWWRTHTPCSGTR